MKSEKIMIEIKEAVGIAKDSLVSLMGRNSLSDIRLEEVEVETIEPDADVFVNYWLVTLSYLPKEIDPLESINNQRIFKTFRLFAETGELVSMKIRELA